MSGGFDPDTVFDTVFAGFLPNGIDFSQNKGKMGERKTMYVRKLLSDAYVENGRDLYDE